MKIIIKILLYFIFLCLLIKYNIELKRYNNRYGYIISYQNNFKSLSSYEKK